MSNLAEHRLCHQAETKSAFIWTRLLSIPFWALFNMLPVILYKDLHATPLQITAMIALKPMASLFAPYWSHAVHLRNDRLISNLVSANILKYFPFLFFPWIQNNWLFIFLFGFYMMLVRGVIPAWMEIFKLNMPSQNREKVFATGSILDYLGTAFFPLAFGWILDDYHESWRALFVVGALIGIFSTFFLYRLPILTNSNPKVQKDEALWSFSNILKPWKASYELLKSNPNFFKFQIGFMLGGSGLMMLQPALPMFFVDHLNLTYTEISVAVIVCKGIGYALSSPYWVSKFQKINIYQFSSHVTVMCALFPFILALSIYYMPLLYISYIVYGIMQAGSELSWHMSGPRFAEEKDSSLYSGTNVLAVGIRGCIAPFVGSLLYTATNSITVLIFSGLLCLIATERMRFYGKAKPLIRFG